MEIYNYRTIFKICYYKSYIKSCWKFACFLRQKKIQTQIKNITIINIWVFTAFILSFFLKIEKFNIYY